MNNSEIYYILEEDRLFLPSQLGTALNCSIQEIDYDKILENLNNESSFSNIRLLKSDKKIIGSIDYDGDTYDVKISYVEQNIEENNDNIEFLAYTNKICEEEIEKWKKSKFLILLDMNFNNNVDKCYFTQLKILDCINPNYIVLLDISSQKVFSSKWVKMILNDNILPLNTSLFSIHSTYDEETNEIWFHTHGLNRCGCIELEMIGITEEAENNMELLTKIGAKFIEEGTIPRYEEINIGYSGNTYLTYTWKPWEEAVKMYGEKNNKFLGCSDDRDESHSLPSGVLFAFKDGKVQKPNIYTFLLKNNPVFFYTNKETEKISIISKIRVKYLKEIFRKDKYKNNYLIKVAIKSDGNYNFDKEHLWFCIKDIEEDNIKGTLINEPYDVSSMKEGETYLIKEEDITDWNIYTEKGVYTPDDIYKYYM